MDKTWLWRKRTPAKTIVANDKAEENEEEILPTEKEVALERSIDNLNEKLASVLCECKAKDELLENNAKITEEATTGWKKVEAEAVSLKQELDEAVQQKGAADERLTQLNTALKESMQLVASVREEGEQKVHDAITKTSNEFEKAHKKLDDRLTNLTVENSHLGKALSVKEKIIEDLGDQRSQAEAEVKTLMARLDSREKENAFLKYEFRMLEKEVEIRNKEMEYNRRSADASHRKHLESIKKITKLEAECQRLRALVRKRLPGPAALAKMKSEVEIPGKIGGLIVRDSTAKNPPEISNRKINFLIERLCDLEEENKILKEALAKREDELLSSRTTFAQMASKLSVVETELSKVQKPMELARMSSFEVSSENETSRSECKTIAVSDMSLMDDFVEMEKLAIVSVDSPRGSCYGPLDANNMLSDSLTCEDLVLAAQDGTTNMDREFQSGKVSSEKTQDWLQDVQKVILEQNHVSGRSLDELVEEIRRAMQSIDHPISGYITWRSPRTSMEELNTEVDRNHVNLYGEIEGLKDELKRIESSHNDLEVRLQLANDQLQESKERVTSLRMELETLKESKRMIEDQIENQKSINEDLDTQLTVDKVKRNQILQKLSSLEVELDDKSHCCEELEGTCLELQLQLESVASKKISNEKVNQEEKVRATGWEIRTASAKLAECQETILNLGKQLKALASPKESAIFDKVLSTTTTPANVKRLSPRASLLDRMIADDGTGEEDQNSPKTKRIISTDVQMAIPEAYRGISTAVALIPSKKRGGGRSLLRKLLLRRKTGSSKKTSLIFTK